MGATSARIKNLMTVPAVRVCEQLDQRSDFHRQCPFHESTECRLAQFLVGADRANLFFK